MATTRAGTIEKVPAESLFVSEPDPSWFGNSGNPRSNKFWTNGNWLRSRFHFSFAEYHDRSRGSFGVLRVMNDDLVQPERGFGTHPHANMEIVTYVVEGELTHQDSMGTRETLGPRSIQFMTAGTGIRHSEFNLHERQPLRFIQMWIQPRRQHLPPNYGSMAGQPKRERNQWAHLVADVSNTSVATTVPVRINQDANIYVAQLDAGTSLPLPLAAGRQAYVLCLDGDVHLAASRANVELMRHDAAQAFGDAQPVSFTAPTTGSGAHILVVEMAQS